VLVDVSSQPVAGLGMAIAIDFEHLGVDGPGSPLAEGFRSAVFGCAAQIWVLAGAS
jgi:hypothetical protein